MHSPEQHHSLHVFIRLAIRSFELDLKWLNIAYFTGKYIFIWKKYMFLIAYQLFWHHQSKSYCIHMWGRNIFLEHREHMGVLQSVFVHNAYLKPRIPKNAIVVDIGAHTGEFALFCDIYLQAKTIYSFEPIAKSYELLKRNKSNNVYHTAIGTAKKVLMHIPKHTVMASALPTAEHTREEHASCTVLDEISEIHALPYIDLFKIDVEGMEYDVVAASRQSLQKSRTILMELSVDRPASSPALQTLALLTATIPGIMLVHVGQIFTDENRTDAIDLLFKNSV